MATWADDLAGSAHTQAYRDFLARLVEARTDARLSQAALAKQLGKPASYVGKYELGERRLDLIETLRILDQLKVDRGTFVQLLSSE